MDWNDDGLIDLIVGERDGYVNYFRRQSDGTLTSEGRILCGGTNIDIGTNSAPFVFDWNSDGKQDLLVGRESTSGGSLWLYLNEGTSAAPVFNSSNPVTRGSSPIAWSRTIPHMEDMDGDGIMDLMIGEDNGHTYFLENTAASPGDIPVFLTAVNITVNGAQYVWPSGQTDVTLTVNDWNEDGILDLIVGNYTKYLFVFLGNQTGITGWTTPASPGGILEIHGNPTGSILEYTVTAIEPFQASLIIYTVDGRQLIFKDLGILGQGVNTLSEPLSDLPEGSYIVCIRTSSEILAERIILLR